MLIIRLGWYEGRGARLITCLPSCTASKKGRQQPAPPPPDPVTGEVDAGWSVTDTVRAGPNWVSGYYLADVVVTHGPQTGGSEWCPFIVLAPPSRHSAILVQVPVNTWQAYNPYGGKSLYTFNSTNAAAAVKVSFNRPFAPGYWSTIFQYEYPWVRFVERHGYDVSYTTDINVTQDPGQLLHHKLVISWGHNEYWSMQQRDAFDAARDAGVNLIFAGADTADWQIRYEDNYRTLVGYKDSPDPIDNPALATTHFADLVPPRPQCQLLGVTFGGAVAPNGIGYMDYTVSPSAIGDPWMAGTGLTAGQTLKTLVGYEWDGVVPGCTPTPTVFLHYAGPPEADAIRYTAPSGARVFSTGSLQYAWGIDSYNWPYVTQHGDLVVPGVQRFTLNVLDSLAPGSRAT
jgi:hypothetical protein